MQNSQYSTEHTVQSKQYSSNITIFTAQNRTKHTEHWPFTWILLVMTAQSLLALFGILNNVYGIYIPAIVMLICLSYILYIKLTYEDNKIEAQLKMKNIII